MKIRIDLKHQKDKNGKNGDYYNKIYILFVITF